MLPVNDLLRKLSNRSIKVIWRKAYDAKYNELFDVFYSFCIVNGRYISLHGEMYIETFYKRRVIDSKIAKLYKCEYEINDRGLVQTSKKLIGLGADPRMVSDGENAYGYVIGYGETKHPAFIYVEKDNSLHPIRAEEGFDWGKNWQPYLKEGRLFIVHELTPYCVYEISLETYQLKKVYAENSIIDLPAHYTNHSMFRGGANAISEKEIVYGLGRASAQPYKHTPFFWSKRNNESPVFQFSHFFNQISDKGFGIIDPTSFFKNGSDLLIGLACSETTWFHGQHFLNLLMVVDEENKFDNLPSLKDVLSDYPSTYINRSPNLARHIFHCDRLQHDIPFSYEYGVQSIGKKGVLVYGPFIEIKERMNLSVELSYLTAQKTGEKAGIFDVYLSKQLENGEVDYVIAADCYLKATDKEIATATIYFDTALYIGYKVEFRVIVSKDYILNAFHIKTKKIAQLPAQRDLIKRRYEFLKKCYHLLKHLKKRLLFRFK